MKTYQSPTKHALYWLLQHINLMIFSSNQALTPIFKTKLCLKHKTIKSKHYILNINIKVVKTRVDKLLTN